LPEKRREEPSVDIFQGLLDASRRQKRLKKERLLTSIGVKEFFEDGNIKIDMKTCKGIECQFCIKVCPTKALYWKKGEVAVVDDLCVYCTSCVLNCMVDGCIEVTRKCKDGAVERFSTPREVLSLGENTNTEKRIEEIQKILPDEETYLKRYRKPRFLEERKKR
jgi:Fe-S-cluster-containing hydrogenase component 2